MCATFASLRRFRRKPGASPPKSPGRRRSIEDTLRCSILTPRAFRRASLPRACCLPSAAAILLAVRWLEGYTKDKDAPSGDSP